MMCASCMGSKLGTRCLALPLSLPLLIEKKLRYRNLDGVSNVICHSQYVAKELGRCGIKAEFVPYPLMVPKAKHKPTNDNVARILFIGRLERRKGADLLVPLAEYLKGNGINASIDVVGDGPLKAMLDRPDLGIRVHGYMGRERLDLFRKADIMAVPSRWPEPFGMVVQEAMAHELPVIAFNSGGLGELVSESGGIITDESNFNNVVLQAIRDPKSMQAIVKQQNSNLKRFDKDLIFRHYLDMFKTLLN